MARKRSLSLGDRTRARVHELVKRARLLFCRGRCSYKENLKSLGELKFYFNFTSLLYLLSLCGHDGSYTNAHVIILFEKHIS